MSLRNNTDKSMILIMVIDLYIDTINPVMIVPNMVDPSINESVCPLELVKEIMMAQYTLLIHF